MTFGDTVYLNNSFAFRPADMTQGSTPGLRRQNINTLVHEFAHVRQFQQLGYTGVVSRLLRERREHGVNGTYDYQARTGPFNRIPLEAQAQMIGDYAMMRETGRWDARERGIYNSIGPRLRGTGVYGQ